MILQDKEIKKRVKEGNLVVKPFIEENVEPSSLDIKISDEFIELPEGEVINPKEEDIKDIGTKKIVDDFYVLDPKEYVLGTTVETFEIPSDLVGIVHGRSSWGRLGLVPHIEAGFIDSGYKGEITLEIANLSNNQIIIPIGSRIAQIAFHEMKGECENPYEGRYQGQKGPSNTKINEDY